MRDRTWKARVAKVLGEEMNQPKVWHYFSFADEQFNGAVIVEAHGITDGLFEIKRLGQNPRGQVMAVPIPAEMLPAEKYRNRLLTRAQVQEFWPDSKTIREHKEEARALAIGESSRAPQEKP